MPRGIPNQKRIEEHLGKRRDALMHDLSKEGYTEAQIARVFNVHRSTVMRVLRGWKGAAY